MTAVEDRAIKLLEGALYIAVQFATPDDEKGGDTAAALTMRQHQGCVSTKDVKLALHLKHHPGTLTWVFGGIADGNDRGGPRGMFLMHQLRVGRLQAEEAEVAPGRGGRLRAHLPMLRQLARRAGIVEITAGAFGGDTNIALHTCTYI